MSHEIDGVIYIVNPIIHPQNEWEEDSPAYYDFWAPVERRLNREVEEAKASGKEWKVITEEEAENMGIIPRESI
jgi:hypothetical protein